METYDVGMYIQKVLVEDLGLEDHTVRTTTNHNFATQELDMQITICNWRHTARIPMQGGLEKTEYRGILNTYGKEIFNMYRGIQKTYYLKVYDLQDNFVYTIEKDSNDLICFKKLSLAVIKVLLFPPQCIKVKGSPAKHKNSYRKLSAPIFAAEAGGLGNILKRFEKTDYAFDVLDNVELINIIGKGTSQELK